MQSFSENSPLNARINVDYTNNVGRASFSYPTKTTFLPTSFFISWFILFLLLSMPVYFVLSIFRDIDSNALFIIIFVIPLIMSFITSASYSHFAKFYPKTNYFILRILQGEKHIIIKNLVRDFWILPKFNNVFLEYRAEGEYATFLRNVEIKEIDYYIKKGNREIKNTSQWECIFSFTQIPKEGKIEIDYV